MNSTKISNIYNARKTICTFMKYRGLDISSYENENINDICEMVEQSQLTMIFDSLTIIFMLDKAIRDSNILNAIKDIPLEHDIIIITKDIPNQTIKKFMKMQWEIENRFITIFGMKQLQYNILEHEFVPQHIKLNPEEKQECLDKYNIKHLHHLPEIGRFDPVAQAIGLKPNDVCKIIRKSKTAIETEYYRVCV